MLDGLIQQWAKVLLPAALPAPPRPHEPSAIATACYSALSESVDVMKGRCRSLQAGMIVLRLTSALMQSDPQVASEVKEQFSKLIVIMESIEELNMQQNSFGDKHVIVLEGLGGAGKSALAQALIRRQPSLCCIDPKDSEIFRIMNAILFNVEGVEGQAIADYISYLPALFHLLLNYLLAARIMQSEATDFIIEEYHHAFVAQQVCEAVESVQELSSRLCAWPLDLPMPELVLYLTCSREVRQLRCTASRTPLRAQAQEQAAEAVYALIRGPGTVGIESHGPVEQVLATALQALDYFGLYSISRCPHTITSHSITTSHSHTSHSHSSHSTPVKTMTAIQEQDENSSPNGDGMAWDSLDSLLHEPIASKDVICSRRFSIGVYGLYTKM